MSLKIVFYVYQKIIKRTVNFKIYIDVIIMLIWSIQFFIFIQVLSESVLKKKKQIIIGSLKIDQRFWLQ